MAYNIPPPWRAGYAIPDNAADEGVQRRTFVTQMTPRGFYDQWAKFSTKGFAVPSYVKDEGLGRGAYNTFMQPAGTYNGPRIPHYQNRHPGQIARGDKHTFLPALSGTDGDYVEAHATSIGDNLPEPFHSFGLKGAKAVLEQISKSRPADRMRNLRKLMDKVDPSLWKRTLQIAARNRAQGMHPTAAFQHGFARALGAGLAAEVVRNGHKHIQRGGGVTRAKEGLLGLGDNVTATTTATVTSGGLRGIMGDALKFLGGTTQVQSCLSDPPSGYTWDPDLNCKQYDAQATNPCATTTGTLTSQQLQLCIAAQGRGAGKFVGTVCSGAYRKLAPGEIARGRWDSLPPGSPKPACVSASSLVNRDFQFVVVGPFVIRADIPAGVMRFSDPAKLVARLPSAWQSAFRKAFDPNGDGANPVAVDPTKNPALFLWLQALGVVSTTTTGTISINWNPIATKQGFSASWWDLIPIPTFGLAGVADAIYQGVSGDINNLTGPPQPIAQFTHPVYGENWGAWVQFVTPRVVHNPGVVPTYVPGTEFRIVFGKIPDKPWYSSLLDAIFTPTAALANVTADAIGAGLSALGNAVCSAMSNPAIAQLGGGIAGAAVGGSTAGVKGAQVGAQAGQVGGALASAACGGQQPPLMASDSGWILPIVIAAGVAGVALLATGKKKGG